MYFDVSHYPYFSSIEIIGGYPTLGHMGLVKKDPDLPCSKVKSTEFTVLRLESYGISNPSSLKCDERYRESGRGSEEDSKRGDADCFNLLLEVLGMALKEAESDDVSA